MRRVVVSCKHYTTLRKGLKHPRVLLSAEGPGTSLHGNQDHWVCDSREAGQEPEEAPKHHSFSTAAFCSLSGSEDGAPNNVLRNIFSGDHSAVLAIPQSRDCASLQLGS